MIIGGAGSGKSTVARMLGDKTGLPVINMDKLYWQSGWRLRNRDETRRLVLATIEADQWIFEGNFSELFQARLARADTLIFLDLPTWMRLARVVRRTIRDYGRVRPDMQEGCPERFDWDFLKWVADYDRRGRAKALQLLADAPAEKRMLHLKSRRQVNAFLRSVS